MKTLQVSMENRVGCTLRGIVTLPETNEPVPFVLNLHGFAGSASGYKYLHTHMARMLADHGVGCARFDFYGCLLYTSPSPRDMRRSRMPSSA